MNFTTLEFLLFYPAVALVYARLPQRARPWLLLAASCLFYAWWNTWTVLLLLGVSLITWLAGLWLARGCHRRLWLGAALAATLGSLAVFKYLGFLGGLVGFSLPALVLPVGISFYTFQSLGYVLDVRRGMPPERNFGYYALFVAFFPQLVAGPIERTQSLLPQLRAAPTPTPGDWRAGGWLMLRGFAKKLALADALAPFVEQVYAAPATATGPAALLATVAFALQIYGDFSGYSDIAVGAARCMGLRLMKNFDRPYTAATLREFWRRWHISLTGWFTDYLYIPLGGSRCGAVRNALNVLLVFVLSGAWHGAAWTFVAWGLLHGLLLAAGVLLRRGLGFRLQLPRPLGVALTFAVVCVGWVFFRAGSVGQALALLAALPTGWAALPTVLAALPASALPALLCVVLLDKQDTPPPSPLLPATALVFAVAVAWLANLSAGVENAFIYFRF